VELVRNKASGKFFVLLDDAGGIDFLVVTPEGKIKRLERRLFDIQEVVDPQKARLNRNLTQPQVAVYSDYFREERSHET